MHRDLRIPAFVARPLVGALLGALPLLLAACDGRSTTEPGGTQLALTSATISVAGQPVNGMTLAQGHGEGGSSRFEARLVGPSCPATGCTVEVRYQRPGGMGGMMATGTMTLYDDGTHGDHTPGDGLYCYEDFAGEYGCHAAGAPVGPYHYDFYGYDHAGHYSNHMEVEVTIR